MAFPLVHLSPKLNLSREPSDKAGNGRSDMVFFFDWLREKGVKRILKVIVDDLTSPSHSDEAIENALYGFDVEILDWRKMDLCPEVICESSKNLREVYLQWSGNNTILRGWSEPDGLKKLHNLIKIHLHVKQVRPLPLVSETFPIYSPCIQDLETRGRMNQNIEKFCDRLRSNSPMPDRMRPPSLDPEQKEEPCSQRNREIDIIRIEKGAHFEPLSTPHQSSESSENQQEPNLRPHRWLECTDKFVDKIQNFWPWALNQTFHEQDDLRKPVKVALIDDGVTLPDQRLCDKILGGKSFDYGNQNGGRMKPYWVSEGKHGTVMARMISRVCPMAKIYVIKLETHYDFKNQKVRIAPRSAAEVSHISLQKLSLLHFNQHLANPSI